MNNTSQVSLKYYQFAWIDKFIQRKRLKIQLTDSQESKSNSQRYKGRFRHFLVRLRSD